MSDYSQNGDLVIAGLGLPPYSARGLSQTLSMIDAAAQLERDVNGNLVDLSYAGFRKWQTTITCNDMRTPVFDVIRPGSGPFTVDCVAEMVCTGTPAFTAVAGTTPRVEGANTFYRPSLPDMYVRSFNWALDEYGGLVGWQLVLEQS